jgi:hypothetical protein
MNHIIPSLLIGDVSIERRIDVTILGHPASKLGLIQDFNIHSSHFGDDI